MNFHLFSIFSPIPRLRALYLWEGFVPFNNDQCKTTEVWLGFVSKVKKKLLLMSLQSLNILTPAALLRIEHTEGWTGGEQEKRNVLTFTACFCDIYWDRGQRVGSHCSPTLPRVQSQKEKHILQHLKSSFGSDTAQEKGHVTEVRELHSQGGMGWDGMGKQQLLQPLLISAFPGADARCSPAVEPGSCKYWFTNQTCGNGSWGSESRGECGIELQKGEIGLLSCTLRALCL